MKVVIDIDQLIQLTLIQIEFIQINIVCELLDFSFICYLAHHTNNSSFKYVSEKNSFICVLDVNPGYLTSFLWKYLYQIKSREFNNRFSDRCS